MKTSVFTSLNTYLQAKALLAASGALAEADDDNLSLTYDESKDDFYFLSPSVIASKSARETHWDAHQISFFGTYRARLLQRGNNFFFVTGDSVPEKLESKALLTYIKDKSAEGVEYE